MKAQEVGVTRDELLARLRWNLKGREGLTNEKDASTLNTFDFTLGALLPEIVAALSAPSAPSTAVSIDGPPCSVCNQPSTVWGLDASANAYSTFGKWYCAEHAPLLRSAAPKQPAPAEVPLLLAPSPSRSLHKRPRERKCSSPTQADSFRFPTVEW